MTTEKEHAPDEYQKTNRQKRQDTELFEQSVELPFLLRDRPLSRKIRDKKENLVSKKARKKRNHD